MAQAQLQELFRGIAADATPLAADTVLGFENGIPVLFTLSGIGPVLRQVADSQALTDQATIAWDVSLGRFATVTLGGSRTMAAPTNLVAGGVYHLLLTQDATGSRLITWNAVFKWPGATAPTLTTTAARADLISFVSDGTNLYRINTTLDVR